MKALILGGYSARMQPSLTFTIPKPLIEFASKPIILYQIEALEAVGVTEVIVAVNYQAQVMQNFLKEHETRLRIKISLSIETEPLGTAGPLALARDKLIDGSGEPFFVLNGDVFCEYPFKEMITFHKSHAGEASILITKNNFRPEEEPLPYAAIGMEKSSGKVTSFVEKPHSTAVGNVKRISTGIYLLNPSILDGIMEPKRTSLEKQVFPRMVADGKVYGVWLKGLFWLDAWLLIDQQRYYIYDLVNHLHDLRKRCPQKLASGAHIVGDVVVDETAEIGEGCVIGPDVAIGPGCIIEAGVKISSSAIMHGTHIKKGASVTYSIIGWRSSVGQLAKVERATMFATNITVRV
ncbi:PREDICTED: mannose-1-phosphate guanylyltransferase 1-like [Ipomoea nil]|uniref:mannose-1-phosphate guanylyltransferase 1-like n=1 Tax=Ipomoea nil TaxID=35883 RepID=UPI00090157EF|nr:PREDICTED: mannose-1-phosphate guanylyltransferase 1-like [Ipomoea nil]XP_019157273.1 PREDICTED: mannose-1-phosphate guanylyltransferase 1-like [Ipomoea nil]